MDFNMPASMILSTFASLIPLICKRSFLGEYATDSTVQWPKSLSFLTSRAAIPDALKNTCKVAIVVKKIKGEKIQDYTYSTYKVEVLVI